MNNITMPKIIKRHSLKKYTQKRSPYKSYLYANWNWEDVFIEMKKHLTLI